MRDAYVVVCLLFSALTGLVACGDNLQGNRPPVASDSNVTTPEDTPVSMTVNVTDPDPDAELTFVFGAPEHGTITQDGRTVTYRPDDDYNGPDSIHVEISDGTYDVEADITITVTPVNDAPVGVDDTLAGNEDAAATVTGAALVANDTDVEGDALTVTAVGTASTGTVDLSGDTITFTPPADFTGAATFEYTVSDGDATDTAIVTVNVGGVNDPPVAVNDALTTAEDTDGTITTATLVANDTDPEMQTLSVTGVGGAVNGTVDLTGGTVTFTPDANYSGAASFTYTVSDGAASATGTVDVTVTPVNDAPVADAGTAQTDEDVPVTITLTGSDVEGSALTFAIVTQPANGTLGAITQVDATSATVVYTPNAGSGLDDSLEFRVNDGDLDSAPATVAIDVVGINDPPVATAGSATTDEDTAVTITLAGTDPDGDMLTFAVATGPTAGSLGAITQLTPTTASVTYTPNANSTADDSFTFTVDDGQVTSTAAAVTIDVVPVNDPPVASAGTATTDEDTAVTITLTGSDVEGANLTFSIVTGPTAGTLGAITPVDATSATVVYTPDANSTAADSFTFRVNDGAADSAPATVSITVGGVNDAPVATAGSATTDEDTAVTITLAGTDADGDPLAFAIVTGPATGTLGAITQLTPTTASVTYTPDPNSAVNDGFTFRVNDGTADSAPATVTITVNPVDDPPVADAVATSTDEDTPVTITLSGADVEGGALTFSIVLSPTAGSLGAITPVDATSATVVYTPNANSTTDDSFSYRVTAGGVDSAPAAVTVDVIPVNDPPIAVNDDDSTMQDTALVRAAAVYAANDTDVDGPALTVSAVGSAVNGTIDLTAGTITFTPDPGHVGPASFEYTVTDGTSSDTGLVTINVFVNTPPVANDDVATTDEDTALPITAAAFAADDIDPDPQTLTITGAQNAVNGTIVTTPSLAFVPDPDYSGPASFEYIVSDGIATDVGLVNVTVTPVNDLPVAQDDTITVDEDSAAAPVDVLANDTDVEGALTVTAVTPAASGTVALVAGVVSYQPNADFAGTDTFTYTVTDSDAATATATVTVTVTNINDAPVAVDQSPSVPENAGTTITLAATDIDSPAVTFAIATPPTQGTLGAITPTGPLSATVVYTPAADYVGPDAFTFTASDGSLTSAPATVTLTVLNVPVCNDGLVEAPEECDDQGNADGDGCSATCLEEEGWDCTGAPSACETVCGDSFVVAGVEECDDGNADETDGCTTECQAGAVCAVSNALLAAADRFATNPADGNCYVSFDDDALMWADAQTACVAAGGHLVSITSAGEQSLAASVHNTLQNPWIGLTDALVEGSFGWITGEPMSFNGFATGQPDGPAGDNTEDCANLFSAALAPAGETSRWNDTSCTFTGFVEGYICELEGEPCGDGFHQPAIGEQCDDGGTATFDGCSASCQLETVFFSEYIEGSSFNKAVEIANPLTTPTDLTGCTLRLYTNGATTPSQSVMLTQTIAPGDVLVVCNSGANAAITGVCDVTSNAVMNHSGDDAIELFCNGATADVIGQIGVDPGSQWGTGLTSTADNTIRRKCSVTVGDTVGSDPFDPSVEWGGFAQDTFDGFGSYQCVP